MAKIEKQIMGRIDAAVAVEKRSIEYEHFRATNLNGNHIDFLKQKIAECRAQNKHILEEVQKRLDKIEGKELKPPPTKGMASHLAETEKDED